MNYNVDEKLMSDIQQEIDCIYNIAILLGKYIQLKDVYYEKIINQDQTNSIKENMRNILDKTCNFLRLYRIDDKKKTMNSTIVYDRLLMNDTIGDLYLKIISERIKLDQY